VTDLPFYIVDVFAEQKFSGNQLAVFTNAENLSKDEMQQIANEMHYSETTFIQSDLRENGGYDVRIFTPAEEVPFAGHPTLGTAFVIREMLQDEPADEIILNLKVGQIPVQYDEAENVLWMHQQSPAFGETVDNNTLAKVLDVSPNDFHPEFPSQIVSTELPFIIAPLQSIDAVKKARLDFAHYPNMLDGLETKAILLFAPETEHPENDLHVRVFAEYYGVLEDPATGSANGCLAGYLAHHQFFQTKVIDIAVEQGYEIGRPSQLFLRTTIQDDEIQVLVGGQVIAVASGTIEL